MIQVRQGDVGLRPIPADQFPAENVQKVRSIILAHGEKTGHCHTLLADPTAPDIELVERDGRMFLRVLGEATITHQEHATVMPSVIPPGTYERAPQREYFPEAPRQVLD